MSDHQPCKIKIMRDGPYLVYGNVPLSEKIIKEEDTGVSYQEGRCFLQREKYALCRCGHSKNMPYCDGNHHKENFNGKETASREPFISQASMMEGPDLLLADVEELCAFARFCHAEHGSVWELISESDNPALKDEAVKAACDCPAGRLVALDKQTKEPIEPTYRPSIVIIQDPERNCSGPIWARGGIPIESADGSFYEIRNRITLCRCGHSSIKPFCDAVHVSIRFSDKE